MTASTATRLLRSDLRGFEGYRSARSEALQGEAWLNANESPWASSADDAGQWRRYPEPQPGALREAMARVYGVRPEQVLPGRGSDEGIDLLLRAFCAPGQGAIVVAPPVFGMYAVCARLHGVPVVEVALGEGAQGFRPRLDAMAEAAVAADASLVFLCSPGNPTGETIALDAISTLAGTLAGRAIVVVDEAYVEFGDQPSVAQLLDRHDNVAVLRTLSKAHALAGLRIGCVLAAGELVDALRRCQAPYPLPQPCVAAALAALAPGAVAQTAQRVARVRAERERLAARLAGVPGIRNVYPSQGNFLLLRLDDATAAYGQLRAAGLVVRDMRAWPRLGDALRISIGTPEQNDAVIAALAMPAMEPA